MYKGNYIPVVIHMIIKTVAGTSPLCKVYVNVTSGTHFYNTVLCAAETRSWFRFAIIKFVYQQITSIYFILTSFPLQSYSAQIVRKMWQNILSNSFYSLETHALLTWQMVFFIMWYIQTYICQWEDCSGYAYDSWCQLHIKIKKPSLHAEITI